MPKKIDPHNWNKVIQDMNRSNEILDVKELKDKKDIRCLTVGINDIKRVMTITGIVPRKAKIINCYTTQKGVVFVYEIT
jgi:hypothetical protein